MRNLTFAMVAFVAAIQSARAEDEIQIYNAEINKPGEWSAELHNNYTFSGKRQADFRGGVAQHRALYGTPELAYGVTDYFELGAYAPYIRGANDDFHIVGGKLRALLVSPDAAARTFFYGLNSEIGWLSPLAAENRWNVEFRPIAGVRLNGLEFIVNPIIASSFGGDSRPINFLPAARIAAPVSNSWMIGIENYSELGRIDRFDARRQQDHMAFLVADYASDAFDMNVGLGRGYSENASSKWIMKLIIGRAF